MPSARHDQVRPLSADTWKLPFLSTTASAEPCVAMQPVSAMPSSHAGRPVRALSLSDGEFLVKRPIGDHRAL